MALEPLQQRKDPKDMTDPELWEAFDRLTGKERTK